MAYDSELAFIHGGPTKIVFGDGASRDAGPEMSILGCSRAVIVTDKGIIAAGLVDRVAESLGSKCAGIFSDVPQDTGIEVVNSGAEFARSNGADVVISIGGGSVIDTAKGICILLTEGGTLDDFEGIQMLTRPQTPHIAIPTTAGTGSEVTWVAVVMDSEKGQKRLIVEYYNAPRVAILDPRMTEKLPPLLTASTGMDAMCHAVEALYSLSKQPIADGLATHAIRLLKNYLPVCMENGSDMTARGQVQIAAAMAGWAFGNSMVSLNHALAHSLGAVCRLPHGIANGILLPHSMKFNFEESIGAYALVAEAMGVRDSQMSESEAAEAAVRQMAEFTKRLKHPQRLSEMGVTESDLEKAAELCLYDGAVTYNPRPVLDNSEALDVLRSAF
ncbi:MAG: iron-containing alcohol dehydrogenase [Syntrophaceae bacterium]